jgi:gamma-glutamylcyclotransferase (GGCT)/AIG2-like uncharacterized protein YtfP
MRAAAATTHLFVYGTLRRDFAGAYGCAERTRLHARTTWLCRASVTGTLFDLGDYPGVIIGDDQAGEVKGDILRLRGPTRTLFSWLDAYEGLSPDGRSGEYERRVATARTQTRAFDCWIYVLRAPPRQARVIANGDWVRPSLSTTRR